MRVYGELIRLLDRDAIVVGDGGDFVSYAGRLIDSYEPGCWLDPGPLGCLGCGFGYALAAKLARPDRQVVLLLGDGAFGFSGMELDTLARHGVAVVAVVGNNGIWALEKHPMEALYGYSVAADLRPATRYDQVATALGCHGELVSTPTELRPALERAFGMRRPRPRERSDRSNRRLPAPLELGLGEGRRVRARRGRPLEGTAQTCLPRHSRPTPTDPGPERTAHGAAGDTMRWTRIRKPPAFSAGGFRSRFGPIGTGRGTCQKGPVRVARTAGGADVCGFARAYVGSQDQTRPRSNHSH